jgi:DNA-binding NarL/FixJ family response regulator
VTGEALVSVVVVDDHTLFRDGLKELLCTHPAFRVVGEGGSGPQAITLAADLTPDVILLDVEMPGPGPRATVKQLRYASPFTKIIVLTMHDDAALVHDLLDCGASAYLAKTIARDELVAAVRAVIRSEEWVLLSVSRKTIQALDRQQEKPASSVFRRVNSTSCDCWPGRRAMQRSPPSCSSPQAP